MVRLISLFLAMMPAVWLAGCQNPARQSVPEVAQGEAEWRKELTPGRKADFALGYLLTNGFDCQLTRDEKGRIERLLATQRDPHRDAAGTLRLWQIDLAIEEETIQTIQITPLLQR